MTKRICEICGKEVRKRRRTVFITSLNPHLACKKCYKEWESYEKRKVDHGE